MSESLTYGSVGGRLGNRRLYPEPHRRHVGILLNLKSLGMVARGARGR